MDATPSTVNLNRKRTGSGKNVCSATQFTSGLRNHSRQKAMTMGSTRTTGLIYIFQLHSSLAFLDRDPPRGHCFLVSSVFLETVGKLRR